MDHLINSDVEYEVVQADIKALRSKAVNLMPKGAEESHKNIISELAAEFG